MWDALEQAERDIEVATSNAAAGYYEWSAYAAQQAARKSVRALLGPEAAEEQNVEPLLDRVAPWLQVPDVVRAAARELDRAADEFAGAPEGRFTEARSRALIAGARIIAMFCRSQIGSEVSSGSQ